MVPDEVLDEDGEAITCEALGLCPSGSDDLLFSPEPLAAGTTVRITLETAGPPGATLWVVRCEAGCQDHVWVEGWSPEELADAGVIDLVLTSPGTHQVLWWEDDVGLAVFDAVELDGTGVRVDSGGTEVHVAVVPWPGRSIVAEVPLDACEVFRPCAEALDVPGAVVRYYEEGGGCWKDQPASTCAMDCVLSHHAASLEHPDVEVCGRSVPEFAGTWEGRDDGASCPGPLDAYDGHLVQIEQAEGELEVVWLHPADNWAGELATCSVGPLGACALDAGRGAVLLDVVPEGMRFRWASVAWDGSCREDREAVLTRVE